MSVQAETRLATARPILRGWSHALAAPLAAAFTAALCARCLGDRPRLATMLVYGLSLVLMYAWSAAYHIVTWGPTGRQIMRQVDHANIFIVIAATSTAIGLNVLDGWERVACLVAVWVPTVLGVLMTVLRVRLPSGPRVALYIATGLAGLVALPGLLSALPLPAILLLILGGLLYATGGLIYSTQRPDPAPHVFGYHEVFHLFVIAGGAAFGLVVWVWVVPFVGV
jgi:hemolysin III